MSTSNASPVELWYTRCGAATASALAIRQNWLQAEFAQGGTVLHSLRDADSLATRNSHFNHSQSGMFREGGNIPPIWAKAGGQDTVVLGITWLDEYQGVLVRADSDIRSIEDLRGRRLGIPFNEGSLIDFMRGAAQHGFTTALSLADLKPSDTEFVDLAAARGDAPRPPAATELDALDAGHVDAIFVRFASGYRISRDARYRQLLNINDLNDPLLRVNNGTPRPITVDRAFLDRHPDIVERYLAVLLRTANWAANHADEVARLLVPESGGADTGDVIATHGRGVHLSFEPKLSEAYIEGLQRQKNFLLDWGYLKADFDVRDWIVTGPLENARKRVAKQPELVEPAAQAA
jgi:ABC-type nitrate/sulfonate/bicarbonate transport system substrate-binding protein